MYGFPFTHEELTGNILVFYKRFERNVVIFPRFQDGYFFKMVELLKNKSIQILNARIASYYMWYYGLFCYKKTHYFI